MSNKGTGAAATRVLLDYDALDDALTTMNESDIEPVLPFIDAIGNANIAYGMAPSGDDWVIGYSTRNPDTGTDHCCWCSHEGRRCDSGADWGPTFPITVLTRPASPVVAES